MTKTIELREQLSNLVRAKFTSPYMETEARKGIDTEITRLIYEIRTLKE